MLGSTLPQELERAERALLSAEMIDNATRRDHEVAVCRGRVERIKFAIALEEATRTAPVTSWPAHRLIGDKLYCQDEDGRDWTPLSRDEANQLLREDDGNLLGRLANCLAQAIDVTVLTVRDVETGREINLPLGSFVPELSERACELLEEAGH